MIKALIIYYETWNIQDYDAEQEIVYTSDISALIFFCGVSVTIHSENAGTQLKQCLIDLSHFNSLLLKPVPIQLLS